jgi:hypothetical protein
MSVVTFLAQIQRAGIGIHTPLILSTPSSVQLSVGFPVSTRKSTECGDAFTDSLEPLRFISPPLVPPEALS